jgi:plastocyanin
MQATIVKHEVDTSMPVTTMKHHDVKIEAVGEFAVATPKILEAKVDDTVRFGSSQQKFRVDFKPWRFKESEHQVTTSELLTFGTEGAFEFLCYVTPNGRTDELLYKEGDGGNGNVTKPGK